MEFGTPSQVNIFVYIAVYIFIVAGLLWSTVNPKKTKPKNSKLVLLHKKYKRFKKGKK